jgi:acylphosphatase
MPSSWNSLEQDAMGSIRAVHVRISGLVQGVAFRAWTERRANALGLSGWVRNLPDGDVEAVFSGPAQAVETMLAAAREGPRAAEVDSVEILGDVAPLTGAFTIRYDR